MVADDFIESFRSLVRRVLDDREYVDFRARYPARVVQQVGADVDVFFDDARLGSKTGVPLAPLPGRSLVLQPGTRVTVGWLGGDERYPRAFPEWDGSGGLVSVTDWATTSWEWDTPLGTFSTDLKCGHLLNGTSLTPANAVIGPAAGVGGAVTGVSGGDVLASVSLVVGAMAIPGLLFTFAPSRPFTTVPQVLVFDGGAGVAPLVVTPAAIPFGVVIPLMPGSYTVRFMMVG